MKRRPPAQRNEIGSAPDPSTQEEVVENPNEPNDDMPFDKASRKDPIRELQARLEAAIDEARPKIRKALAELDEKVEEAMQDIRPKAKAAVRDVQPKIDEFVADVQPRLDTLLKTLQDKIDEIRRELNSRAARHKPNGASLGELAPPPSDSEGPGSPGTMP